METKNIKSYLAENWLCLLIAAQPLLDALAYWTRGGDATVAGYIRLVIMLVLPLHLLFTLKKKRNFILLMFLVGLACALHVFNGFRTGMISLAFDVSYMAKIAQAPVLAVCFCYYIKDEKMKTQAFKGIIAAAVINLITIAVAFFTGTWNSTYGAGIGLSGWVIDDNRCANSIIFVSLSTFAVYVASVSEKKLFNIGLPALVWFMLIANGTKACYLALFALLLGYAVFMLVRRIVTGERIKKAFLITLVVLFVLAIVVYPISPRAIVDESLQNARNERQDELVLKLAELGYDAYSMSFEEKFNNPEVRAIFEDYYYRMIGYVIPDLFDRFGMERVLIHYGMSVDAEMIIDTRVMKRAYAALIWAENDGITHLFGIQPADVCLGGSYDLENDYHALYYYTGYVGFAMYLVYIAVFAALIIRKLFRDFKGSFTMFNCCLLLCFALQLGLAHFSGSVLRRPNVSIYFAVVQALLYYQCVRTPRLNEKV